MNLSLDYKKTFLLGFGFLTFILFSIPGGMLAERWGRRQTILTGLVALSTLLILASFIMAIRASGELAFLFP